MNIFSFSCIDVWSLAHDVLVCVSFCIISVCLSGRRGVFVSIRSPIRLDLCLRIWWLLQSCCLLLCAFSICFVASPLPLPPGRLAERVGLCARDGRRVADSHAVFVSMPIASIHIVDRWSLAACPENFKSNSKVGRETTAGRRRWRAGKEKAGRVFFGWSRCHRHTALLTHGC